MFLKQLMARNPRFLEAAMALHRQGKLPGHCVVIDLDAVRHNAALIAAEGRRQRMTVLAMTKQMGRHPDFCAALRQGGLDSSVAVDTEDARFTRAAGLDLGHVGHLVQVPRHEAAAVARMGPRWWTVFNPEKAAEAAAASRALGRRQDLLARIHAPGDRFYPGHEGGFDAAAILDVAARLDALPGARLAGVTSFPAQLFDHGSGQVRPTPNLDTLARAAEALHRAGRADVQVNAPGTTSAVQLAVLASRGVTQVEPGHALTGTTPLHAVAELPERPAACVLSEVSHLHQGQAYCFGGGFYVDPVFPDYPVQALVGRETRVDPRQLAGVALPPPSAIDYYAQVQAQDRPDIAVGDTVVLGFRLQAFASRALVVGLWGVDSGLLRVGRICHANGAPAHWPDPPAAVAGFRKIEAT